MQALPAGVAGSRRLCKRYLRTFVAQRTPVQLSERNPDEAPRPEFAGASHPALNFTCELCGAAFLNRRRLAVHLARMHRIRSKAATIAWGTRCERCQTEFWNVARLSEHLRRSEVCQVAYDHSDLAPTGSQVTGKVPPAWQPATRVPGPMPFWATLSPAVGS